ncbi:MAG: TetR/AcrR family transcriptional regulator [Hydrogenophaga sp.]|uniref:TetR/AcrR family transcriptional regulator n=1 Tax=Hydrogenophaga sp. TaxID=1904254 RepID=UPI003D0A45EA
MRTRETPFSPTHSDHQGRLLQAMANVAASQGLAAASIAAVVAEAGVSKRTFYEHFSGKDDCFLALYRAASGSALRTLREAVDPTQPWQHQVERALGAYLAHLAAGPELVRMLFVEIHHLGSAGAEVRREVMQALADFMLETIRDRSAFSPDMAMAAVGGIHELVLQAIERGEAAQLEGLTPGASKVVRLLAGADKENENGLPKQAV